MFDVCCSNSSAPTSSAKGMGEIAGCTPARNTITSTPRHRRRCGSAPPGGDHRNRRNRRRRGPAARLLGLPPVDPATCVWFAADTPPITEPLLVLDEGTGQQHCDRGQRRTGICACRQGVGRLPHARPRRRAAVGATPRHLGAQVAAGSIFTDAIPHGPHSRRRFPEQRTALLPRLRRPPRPRRSRALYSGRRCADDPRRLIRSRWVPPPGGHYVGVRASRPRNCLAS